ncbi:MAG TPA: hypothetical protein VHD81_04080 [Mycobacteriales bacterium]|nr:hypothetical protein [Mycobacteriales bacterium]
MSRALHLRVLGGLTAAALTVVLAGCGDDKDKDKDADHDADSSAAQADAACPDDISTAVKTALPTDVPNPGGVAYDYESQGKTRIWFFALDGSPDSLSKIRDTYDTTLTGKGYKIGDTDQEEESEAEAEFDGPHDGTVNVRNLCEGKAVLRLTLHS